MVVQTVAVQHQVPAGVTLGVGTGIRGSGGKCGYLDRLGNLAIGARFLCETIESAQKEGPVLESLLLPARFDEGMAPVGVDKQIGFINKTGTLVIQPQFTSVQSFSEGFAAVQSGKLWGYIDKVGKAVIPMQYADVAPFSEGLAAVQLAGK